MKILICDVDGVLQKSTYSVDKNKKWDVSDRKRYIDSLVDNGPAVALVRLLMVNGWRIFLCTGRRKSDMGVVTLDLAKRVGARQSDVFFYPEIEFDRDIYAQFKVHVCESIDASLFNSRSEVEAYFIDDDNDVCDRVQKSSVNLTKMTLSVLRTIPF